MEPRALMSVNTSPFKDKEVTDLDKAQRALAELSLNQGNYLPYTTNWRH